MQVLNDNPEAQALRDSMIEGQLKYRGIQNTAILKAFKTIPRHLFVPHVELEAAYADHPIPIQAGQTISQPYIVAVMLQYLELRSEHTILELGSGSGYATALLSKLCHHVDAVEVYAELLEVSRKVIEQIGLTNVDLIHGSAWEQLSEPKVYDRIVLWASPARIPPHLFDLLRENGIMVAPEGKQDQYVWIYKKQLGKITKTRKDAVRFVPLVQGTVKEIDGIGRG